MTNRFLVGACALLMVQQVAVARSAAAQQATLIPQSEQITQTFAAPDAPVAATVSTAQSATPQNGPTIAASQAGIVTHDAATRVVNGADPYAHAGQNVALMVVGGAAFIAGLLIGGNGGGAIAIGGAVVGLYGLYRYLQ